MPIVSVIIPVHNAGAHLRSTLDSVLGQSLSEIEVICVDDLSDDDSPEILRQYAERDARVRVITFTENLSASQARKDGVAAATGEFIAFVDADDALRPEALEQLVAEMRSEPVEILHFGTNIVNDANLPAQRIQRMEEFVRPYDGRLSGRAILDGAFSERRLYNFTLWDKLYSAELCKKAFARVKDGSFPKAQDKYAYFLLAYFASSYRGVPGRVYYDYHFGRGVTGHNTLSMAGFRRYATMSRVADAIHDFLDAEGQLEELGPLHANVRRQLLNDCVSNWYKHVSFEDSPEGFDLMVSGWGTPEVVARITDYAWREPGQMARRLAGSASLARRTRDARVIGTYYHRYANGGVQRVLSLLIKLWLRMGYEVVLFTDEPPSADDYELPAGVDRIVLPSFHDIDRKNYLNRARALRQAVVERGIDIMVYHAWVSRLLLWDLLVCKTAGASFIVHCHSVFSQPLRNGRRHFADLPSVNALADGVVALSEVDEAYWSNFIDNVTAVANPLSFDLSGLAVAELRGKQVLWLGRISDEKRPEEALEIFAKVLKQEPEATLTMVGETSDTAYMAKIHKLIGKLGIEDSVVIKGFQKDVMPFYREASVFLMTSEFEGFPQVLSECQSAGLPCVMYRLPYLTQTRSRQGIVEVEIGDVEGAADAVADLLGDEDRRRALGHEARRNAEAIAAFDFASAWRGIFERASRPAAPLALDETTRIMWDTLLNHYRIGAVRQDARIWDLKKEVEFGRGWRGLLRRLRRKLRRKVKKIKRALR